MLSELTEIIEGKVRRITLSQDAAEKRPHSVHTLRPYRVHEKLVGDMRKKVKEITLLEVINTSLKIPVFFQCRLLMSVLVSNQRICIIRPLKSFKHNLNH